jgi:glycosyltransferase involved in cell wall biosynthesis
MKHVWILNQYALEPSGAGGTRHFSLAKQLPEHGWSASIIAASFELNKGRQRLESAECTRLEVFDGVPFLWLRTPVYEGNGAGRMVNMLTYALRALLPSSLSKLPRPDVIIGSSVHPFAAWAGALLASRYGVPFVFEVRDLWPQTLIDLGRLRADSLLAKGMLVLEHWLYRRASKIITLLPRAAEYIVPLGVPHEKIVWIPNGVDLDGFPVPAPSPNNDVFTLMYFGAHGQTNDLANVLQAMAVLKRRGHAARVRLRMIGDGPKKPSLMDLAQELGLDNVSFENPVSKRMIPTLASEADAFVFNLVDAPVFRFGISSNKLFDFLAGARPVLFCCNAANNPVNDAGCGITVLPGDPEALADAVVRLLDTPDDKRAAMGRAGRAFVELNNGFRSLGARLAQLLDSCVH